MVNHTRINSAQSKYFWNITRRQAKSPVTKFHHVLKAWFHDSAGDIDFHQMSFSQSESTIILHESIILQNVYGYRTDIGEYWYELAVTDIGEYWYELAEVLLHSCP